MNEIVDMCKRERELTKDFILHIDKWDSMDPDVYNIVSGEWKSFKYFDDDGKINCAVNDVPDDKGGIYVFLLKPDIIPSLHRYIMYIGRARRGQSKEFSLKKRCRRYLKDTRPEVAYMRETWGPYLYYYYLPLDDDNTIEKVERELNRVIIPPCNSDIPDRYVEVRPAKPVGFIKGV